MATKSIITEDVLANWTSADAYHYALSISSAWPLGELLIAQNAYYSYRYALHIIKCRFPPGEAEIAQSVWATHYFASFQNSFTEHERLLWLLKQ